MEAGKKTYAFFLGRFFPSKSHLSWKNSRFLGEVLRGVDFNWSFLCSTSYVSPLFCCARSNIPAVLLGVGGWQLEFGLEMFVFLWIGRLGWLLVAICARVDQLPLFPYNRGWENQPNGRGLYTHYKDSVIKGGMTISNTRSLDPGSYVFGYYPEADSTTRPLFPILHPICTIK